MAIKSIPIYLQVCVNCHDTAAFEEQPPDCFNYKCVRCGYTEYHLYVVKGIRLTQPHDKDKLMAFRKSFIGEESRRKLHSWID